VLCMLIAFVDHIGTLCYLKSIVIVPIVLRNVNLACVAVLLM